MSDLLVFKNQVKPTVGEKGITMTHPFPYIIKPGVAQES